MGLSYNLLKWSTNDRFGRSQLNEGVLYKLQKVENTITISLPRISMDG